MTSADASADPEPPGHGPAPELRRGGPRRSLVAGGVLYITLLLGVMLWRGIEIEPQWVILALLLIAVFMGRGRQFIGDWAPFLGLFLAYELMRGFAARTGFLPHDLTGMELGLFAGHLPSADLQRSFYSATETRPWDWVAVWLYFLHFPLPILVGFVFWIRNRGHYWRFVAALLLMCMVAFIVYLFWPSTPPWLQHPDQVHKVADETIRKSGVQYLVLGVYAVLQNLNPNRYAAFPSLHAAFPALAAIYAWHRYRLLALGLCVYTAAVWVAIVYLGEHYLVDALAGLALAGVATLAVEVVARRQATRRLAVESRPTPARPSS